ncbi:hypothetical protein AK830_g2043 [Neonectria ditissima]|uniref:F-box domain-containing protein n=1 Tax=Neonectria ditissima TaxID=78410 RepID=A0A0P7BL99_9HYPO|nr:hypothetical protein AK830_g2043 [Neonectria ditissima]
MAQVQLLGLPAEVIDAICRALCLHCMDNPIPPPSYGWHPYHSGDLYAISSALSCLSQTCSTLRAYAQPILYHYPRPFTHGDLSLVRTLVTRPDLAKWVKRLDLGQRTVSVEGQPLSAEDIPVYEASMAECRGQDGKPVRVSRNWSTDDFRKLVDGPRFQFNPTAALSALVVTRVPNVQHLCVELDYGWEFPFCQPGSLPHLTELTIRDRNMRSGTKASQAEGILAAAPNLIVFNGFMVVNCSRSVSNGSVIEVNLKRSALDSTSLSRLMHGFKKLQSFSYEAGDVSISRGREETPRELFDALRIRADSLQHISLAFDDSELFGHLKPGGLITSFKEMHQLKSLSISAGAIYRKMEEADNESIDDGTLLVEILPSSIQSLTIHYPTVFMFKAIVQLIITAHSRFPSLEEVRLPSLGNIDMEHFRMARYGTKVNVYSTVRERYCVRDG